MSALVDIWNSEVAKNKMHEQTQPNTPPSSSSSAQSSPTRVESSQPNWARVLHHVKMSASLYSESSLSMLMDCVSA
ncbi:hypothetical protein BVRB_9g218270 [Beta vulgaris subsp. vulgaris]|nr:hypothetical protein BVRB_9g218270 [Beta vulgaris subsp. vulgaris]